MSQSTRRTFLQGSTLSALAPARACGANDRINIAIIGIGGRGREHIRSYAKRSRKQEDLHAGVEVGRISADLCHLANISYRLGGCLLNFDKTTERFDDTEANQLAHPRYRDPYVIPQLA
jgi:hypothetical protein